MKVPLWIFKAFWPSMLLIIPRNVEFLYILISQLTDAKEGRIEVCTVKYRHSLETVDRTVLGFGATRFLVFNNIPSL